MNPLLEESACGHDWRLATEEHRRAFCAAVRPPHVEEAILLETLDMLLLGRAGSLVALKLSHIVAMVLAADQGVDGMEPEP